MARLRITYADACRDPKLFGPWFEADSWGTWRVLDKAIFGEPLTPAELVTFTELTGRTTSPTSPVSEAWIIAGRRSGKDVKAASIAAYVATIAADAFNFRQYLAPGERGVVQLLAVDRNQAQICLGYLKAMFEQRLLASMVERQQPDGLELTNGLAVEITTNDKRRVRGRTVVACIMDEVAFWMSDEGNSVNPDTAVYEALTPAMATIPNAMLIGISSPYARKGLLWRKFREHYGKDPHVGHDPAQPPAQPPVSSERETEREILVVKAPTWVMNPTLSRDKGPIARAYVSDPLSASAEYGAEFRSDVAGFLDFDAIDATIDRNVRERPPQPRTNYVAFADPSGGSSDAFTLAIAHLEYPNDPDPSDEPVAILDLVREIRPPFDPAEATAQLCLTLKAYNLTSVTGDRYAAQWVVSAFQQNGIIYEHSSRSRSEIYLELLPQINAQQVRLLDLPKLTQQFAALERRTSRTGRDSVDHPKGSHDDLANAAAGALVIAASQAHSTDTDIFKILLGTSQDFRPRASARFVSTPDDQFAYRYDL